MLIQIVNRFKSYLKVSFLWNCFNYKRMYVLSNQNDTGYLGFNKCKNHNYRMRVVVILKEIPQSSFATWCKRFSSVYWIFQTVIQMN